MISMLAGDAVAAGANLSWLGTLLTLTFVTVFSGWAWWAWKPSNRARMETYANIPFDDGDR